MSVTRINPEYVKPYAAGDVISGVIYTAGYLTSSAREVCFSIPLSRPLNRSVAVTYMGLIVRQNNSYPVGSGSWYQNVTQYTHVVVRENSISFSVIFPSALSAQNNSAVGILVEYNISVN